MIREVDKDAIRRWRKRGFYSENALVKLLHKNGYDAVRIPVSNPSLNPLPDVIGRKEAEIYAFEVKNAKYYAYFPKQQIDKLFRFLDQLIPVENAHKHAVTAAHLGKKWIFREISWKDYEKAKLPEKVRILKRDRGNVVLIKKRSMGGQ
jgi:Holliday junction resolvase